jgi:nicotinamide riboside kinase
MTCATFQKKLEQMLEQPFVGNFQGFGKNAKKPLSQLALIFGPNCLGKSSLDRALRELRQSSANENSRAGHIWAGSEIDLGTSSKAIRGQLASKSRAKEVHPGVAIAAKHEGISGNSYGLKFPPR